MSYLDDDLFDSYEYQRRNGEFAREQKRPSEGPAISRELVDRMNGVIGCDSVYGTASTFWVELPLKRSKKLN